LAAWVADQVTVNASAQDGDHDAREIIKNEQKLPKTHGSDLTILIILNHFDLFGMMIW